jgi:hypothetical protein
LKDIEKLPFSFGLGAGVVAFQLYVYSRFHIFWNVFLILVPWILLLATAFYFRKNELNFTLKITRVSVFSKLLIILIVILLFIVFIESISRPIPAWDGWASWLFRAKMFFVENGVKTQIFSYVPSEYPVIVSLMTTFLYKVLGFIDDRSVLLLYPSFYLSLTIMFFFSLKKTVGVARALLFTFLLISTQNIIRHSGRFEVGQADFILGFYMFASFSLFILFSRSKKLGNFILLQLFLAITALIKNEGIPFVLIIQMFLLVFIYKHRLFKILPYFLYFVIPFGDWQIFKASVHLFVITSYIQSSLHPERVGIIIYEYMKEFLKLANWNLLWIAFFVSYVVYIIRRKSSQNLAVPYIIVFLQLLVYCSVFLFTSTNPMLHIPNVNNRELIHLAPIAVYIVCIVFSKLKYKNYEEI